MIKILIADDQELIRQSLQIILNNEADFEVTDAVANGLEVVRSVRKNRPDIILMDIRMPEMDGVVCTQIIKENYPDIKIIIVTTFDDDEYVFNALKYGASGYMLKGASMKDLSDAIRLWRFALTVFAGAGGLFGLTVGTILLLIHLAALSSLGEPYLAPFSGVGTGGALTRKRFFRRGQTK